MPTTLVRFSLLLTIAPLGCAALIQPSTERLTIGPTSTAPAPPAWATVRLTRVTTTQPQPTWLQESPTDLLYRTLTARLASGAAKVAGAGDVASGSAAVTLAVENVHIVNTSSPQTPRFGLAADFVLRGPGGEKRIRLEHSINVRAGDDDDREAALAQLFDDLCDQLFQNGEALAFLAGSGATADSMLAEGEVLDSGLERGATNLGPVEPTLPSQGDVTATGRVIWGHHEKAEGGGATIMLGDTKLISAYYQQRNINLKTGLGTRMAAGLTIMPGRTSSTTLMGTTVDTSTPTAFGVMLMAGAELGLYRTKHTPSGYVDRPGLSLALVPQAMGFLLLASQNNTSSTTTIVQLGGAAELDLPLIRNFGLTASVFAGASGASVSAGSMSYSSGFQFTWFPSADVYLQTATGRISLGLAFQSLTQAISSLGSHSKNSATSIFKNPQITFTYASREGRGLAYQTEDLAALGVTAQHSEKVMANPESAFFSAAGAPVRVATGALSGVGISPSGSASAAAPGSAPAPAPNSVSARSMAANAPQTKAPSTDLWLVLPPRVAPTFPEGAAQSVAAALVDTLAGRHLVILSGDRVRNTLATLGVQIVAADNAQDVLAAFAARHAVDVELQDRGSEVHFVVTRFDRAVAVPVVRSGDVSRVAMLRVLREQVAALAAMDRSNEPTKTATPSATPPEPDVEPGPHER